MINEVSQARDWRYQDIPLGMREKCEYVITAEIYECFLAAFGDRSPIHVDPEYARACGFSTIVMPGAILNGFLSHFVGMHFPGRRSLILSVDLRFSQPSFLGDVLRLDIVVAQKLDARQVVVLDSSFTNVSRDSTVARGRICVLLRNDP